MGDLAVVAAHADQRVAEHRVGAIGELAVGGQVDVAARIELLLRRRNPEPKRDPGIPQQV